jgi:hypothetical protein
MDRDGRCTPGVSGTRWAWPSTPPAAPCGSPTTAATWLGDNLPSDEVNRATAGGQHFGFLYCHQGDVLDPEFGSVFEQSLAVANIAHMLRPEGFLLSNSLIFELPPNPIRRVGPT